MDSFYRSSGASFEPSTSTRGPWDPRFQHGGPPSALLLNQMTKALNQLDGFVVSRLTTEFLRPVPLAAVKVEIVSVTGGRTVQRVRARLLADKVVMEATAVFVRQTPGLAHPTLLRPGGEDLTWPSPDEVTPFVFPFFQVKEAYHQAVGLRLLDTPWGTTPVRCWARPLVPLLDDIQASPEEAVVVVADAESGIGPPVSPDTVTFLNPDLTVYFGRRPQPGWVGLAVRSRADGVGRGLSESELRDEIGVFGRSAQSLVMAAR